MSRASGARPLVARLAPYVGLDGDDPLVGDAASTYRGDYIIRADTHDPEETT